MIHISKLSLKNFKSFKRVAIPIPQGFTAIVGPNGSGKSNIIDAVCFVLGRSSAKSLRAERFSDLIFNGGKNGNPAKFAEVSLYLDNSGREVPIDAKEVKITRTIDNTGISIYRLNNRRTSRTEILDVLSAALIQPDGHNIVLQGDVTKVIEMNPIERRGIIDEIAGIAEYDEKKRKAQRELEKVSENISKVDAVLGEIKEQVQKLEKEKNDALRHEFLEGEIKRSKGIVLSSHLLEVLEGIEKLNQAIKSEEERNLRINKYLNVLALKSEVKKKELERLNADIIVKKETEQFEIFKEIERIKNRITSHEDRVNALKTDLEGLEERYAKVKSGMAKTSNEIREYKSKNKVLAEEQGVIDKKIAKVKTQINAAYENISKEDKVTVDQREKLTDIRARLEGEQGKLFEAEKDDALLREKKNEKDRIYQDLTETLQEKKAKLDELNKTLKNSENKKDKIESDLQKNILRKREIWDKSVETRRKINKISTILQLKIDEFAKLNAKYKAIERITQKKLSFNNAIDAVLKLRDEETIKGIHGTISELGKVNPKFSRALEAAAGRGLQFIVVDTDRTAEKCIAYLKEKRIGRASFLPLNKLRARSPNQKAIRVAKRSYGFALDLVDFNDRFKPAFAHVFRNTVIVEDIAFARKVGIGEIRMVTLEGDLIEPSGTMSGGFYKPSGMGFEEVDASKKQLKDLENEIKNLERKRDALVKKEEELRQELEDLRSFEIDGAKEKEILCEKIKSGKEGIEEIIRFIADKEVLAKEIASDLKIISKKIKKRRDEITSLRKIVSKLKDEKTAIEAGLQDSKAEKILKGIRELESRLSSLEKEKDGKRNQISLNKSKIEEILHPRFSELKSELKGIFSSKKELAEQLKAIDKEKTNLESSLSILKEKEKEIRDEIKNLNDRRDFFIKGINKIERKNSALRDELNDIAKRMEHAKIEKARLETRLEDINRSLKQYADLEIKLDRPIDTAELEDEITKMEVEMASLEPINMRAIEDFETVKEKFEKLNQRIEKLLNERQAINKLMKEIEHRKKAIFMEVFENISANFRRIFSQLSPGGTAELLLDEQNPLEGGLQIQTKPEGKNLQLLEAMSGGEKTLTAVSFIFAIQRYQPAPFYVLDEVDMFLDDDNVRKVSELIKDSAREAQFVVVSLKDSLMSSADRLFGVSNEDGVSKIIGVELEEVGA